MGALEARCASWNPREATRAPGRRRRDRTRMLAHSLRTSRVQPSSGARRSIATVPDLHNASAPARTPVAARREIAVVFVSRVPARCLPSMAIGRRTFGMATAPATIAPRPEIDHTSRPSKTVRLRFVTPVLVLLMALAIALTITRNWNAWEGGRIEQVTNDAYVRRDLTPLSTKVVGLVREVKANDYQQVRKGDELVLLADDDYRAQVSQA